MNPALHLSGQFSFLLLLLLLLLHFFLFFYFLFFVSMKLSVIQGKKRKFISSVYLNFPAEGVFKTKRWFLLSANLISGYTK